MEHKGRESKVIDHMCLVVTITEIGNVVLMRNIGFRDKGYAGADGFDHVPQQFHDFMGFRQVDTFGPGFGPYVGDSIQPQYVRAVSDIKEDAVHHLHEDIGIAEIQVDLVL